MAWNISKAKRQALVKLQLRDKEGKFIEMGGGVKWYSSRLKKVVAGTVVGTKGPNALVRLNKENPTHEPALVSVPAASIIAIEGKASLAPKGGKPSADQTPEFEKPEAVADVEADPNAEAESDHASQLKGPQHLAANYGITETPDGNTYITRNDGESIYSPARALKVGDELISPAGADPTKPFSIGRGWATKGTERLNKEGEGPVIGKVIAISENRYAVVQMAGGHTIADRRNPEEQTDTVTVGLSNQVILATMGLKDALGDRVSSQTYAERPSDEDKEVAPTAPEAQSDHVGREVPEDQLEAEATTEKKISDVSVEEMSQMPKGTVLRDPEGNLAYFVKEDGDNWAHHLSNGHASGTVSTSASVKNSDSFNNHTFAEPGTVPNASEAPEEPADRTQRQLALAKEIPVGGYVVADDDSQRFTKTADNQWQFSGGQQLIDDASMVRMVQRGEGEGKSYKAGFDGDGSTEAPESAPEQTEAPEAQPAPESPAEEAPEAVEEAPQTETPSEEAPEESGGVKATPVNDIVDGLAELEQAAEDVEDSGLEDEEADEILNGASFGVVGNDGTPYNVTAEKDENGDWNFVVADENGAEVASHVIGSDENRVLAERIANPAGAKKAEEAPAAETTPESAPEATPEAPEAESYNENGLTEAEQRELTGYTRLASRSYEQFKDEEGDRYKALADELLARGEERKASTPAEQAEKAPESAPQAEEAPEATPEADKPAEDAPEVAEAPKANVSLADLEAQAKADGDTVLYHGGLPDGTTLDDIDLNRNGTQQNRSGRSYGGFYLTDESSKDWSNSYAQQRNGVMHGFAIDKNARIDDRGDQQIDRLSAEERAEAAKTADVIKGKDLLGRTQYVLLNKDAVKGVGETNINDDKSAENSAPAPSLVEPDAAPEEAEKAPVNGEEGFVPIDGRGLKDSKEESTEEAPAANGPFGISYEYRNGLDHPVASNPEAMNDEENAEFERQDIALSWAQHENRRGAEAIARGKLADLERRVQSRIDSESMKRQRDIQNGDTLSKEEPAPEQEEEEEVSPLSDEEMGDLRERLNGPSVTPAVNPDANEDGLLPNEAARLVDLENRQAAAFRGESNEDPASFDAEISELIRHGRLRGRGREVGPFVARNPAPEPAPEQDSTPEVAPTPEVTPEPAAPEAPATEAAPAARRTRNSEPIPVADADGNMITRGDKIGHPTLGPVEITNTIPGTGRIEFIDPTTGRKKSVKAARVRKIDPNAAEAAPEEQSSTVAPGERFVDAATGKQGFGDANGNRVLVGDRIRHSNGNTGTVKAVYTAGNGGAWPAVTWDSDGKVRRAMGNVLEKDDSTAPEATPEAAPEEPFEVARPSASPATAPEPAPAPAEEPFEPARPSATPAPEATPEAAPEAETHEAMMARLQALVDATPVNGKLTSGSQNFYKISDSQWQFNEGNLLTPTAVQNMMALGELRGERYEIAEGRPAQVNAPAEDVPAVDSPVTPAAELTPAERERRIGMLRQLPAGTTIKPRSGQYTLTKNGSDDWSSTVDNGVYDTEDIYEIVTRGRESGLLYEVTRPNSGQPAPTAAPEPEIPLEADSLVPPTVASRLEAFRRAPVGTTVTSPGGTTTYTKAGDDEWTNPDISGATIKNSTLAIATDSDNGHWIFNKTGPAEPEGTNITAMSAMDKARALRQAPIGSKLVSTGGKVITKTADRLWTSDNGTEYEPSDLITVTDRRNVDVSGAFGLVLPPTPKPIPQDLASRIRVSEEAPIGTVVTSSSGESYTKISDTYWADTATLSDFKYALGEFASKLKNNPFTGNYFVQGFDVPDITPEASASSAAFTGTLPANRSERHNIITSLPIGSMISVRGYFFEKIGEDAWDLGDGEVPHTNLDVAHAGSTSEPGEVTQPSAPFVPPAEPFTGGELSSNDDERAWQISQIPEGGTIVGGRNNTTYVRRGADLWSPADNPEEYYNDSDIDFRLKAGRTTPPVATMPAPVAPEPEGIHPGLKNGSFVPAREGSETGFKRVGDDKWEMIKDGQPTGRFATDETAQMFMELSETSVIAPKTEIDFGDDLGVQLVNGMSIGEWMEANNSNFGLWTESQKKAFSSHYKNFIDNLNTKLPEGYTAKLQDEYGGSRQVKFGSSYISTAVSFFYEGSHIGTAERIFRSHEDSRTFKTVSSVEHNLFRIADEHQGAGVSSAFLKASKQMYRQMGLDRITIHANIDVGGYAWARGGFDFVSYNRMKTAFRGGYKSWDRVIYTTERGALTNTPKPAPPGIKQADWLEGIKQYEALKAKATEQAFKDKTHPAPILYTEIGRPDGPTTTSDTWFGKYMMLNSDWYGMFPLNSRPEDGTVAETAAPAAV